MTRRRDLMCEDLFGCDHSPETPISEGGEVTAYVCRCGQRRTSVEETQEGQPRAPGKRVRP